MSTNRPYRYYVHLLWSNWCRRTDINDKFQTWNKIKITGFGNWHNHLSTRYDLPPNSIFSLYNLLKAPVSWDSSMTPWSRALYSNTGQLLDQKAMNSLDSKEDSPETTSTTIKTKSLILCSQGTKSWENPCWSNTSRPKIHDMLRCIPSQTKWVWE